jgi:hypothetical protein
LPGLVPIGATLLDVADRVDDAVESLGELLIAAGLIILASVPEAKDQGRLARDNAVLLAIALIGAVGAATYPVVLDRSRAAHGGSDLRTAVAGVDRLVRRCHVGAARWLTAAPPPMASS